MRLMETMDSKTTQIHRRAHQIAERAIKRPANIDELMRLEEYLAQAQPEIDGLMELVKESMRIYDLLTKHRHEMDATKLSSAINAWVWPRQLGQMLEQANAQIQDDQESFEKELIATREQMACQMSEWANELELVTGSGTDSLDAPYEHVASFNRTLQAASDTTKLVQSRETVFGWRMSNFAQVDQMLETLAPYRILWHLAHEVLSWKAH